MGAGQETINDETLLGAALKTLIPDDLAELFLIKTEVENARDGESTLLDQIDSLQALITTLVAGSGVLTSSEDTTIGYLEGKVIEEGTWAVTITKNNTGGNENLSLGMEQTLKQAFLL